MNEEIMAAIKDLKTAQDIGFSQTREHIMGVDKKFDTMFDMQRDAMRQQRKDIDDNKDEIGKLWSGVNGIRQVYKIIETVMSHPKASLAVLLILVMVVGHVTGMVTKDQIVEWFTK